MPAPRSDSPRFEDPLAHLEQALIDEFIRARGHSPLTLADLPEAERLALLKDASRYASGKLCEVESRMHLVHELHDTASE